MAQMIEVAPVKYVFLDVVGYSLYTRNAQEHIVKVLQTIVEESVANLGIAADRTVYLPTGDGMCVVLERVRSPFDAHLKVALSVLKGISRHNGRCADDEAPAAPGPAGELIDSRRFDVRIGLNSGEDIPYTDINGRPNYAGVAINMAARIMGTADRRQVLVGQAVYDNLHVDDLYKNSFTEYKATFRHGVTKMVYQFTPREQYEGLDTSPPPSLSQAPQLDELPADHASELCSMKRYDSRGDAELKQEIIAAVADAKSRVWLLGVAVADEINLIHDLRRKLDVKVGAEVDVKILLLDALRSPAMFRAFLEAQSDTEWLGKLVNRKRAKPRPDEPDADTREYPDDPYFVTDVYTSFEETFRTLMLAKEHRPEYKRAVRYHAHTPSCWLLVIDDAAYYQPYTFGRREEFGKPSVGDQMPVFRVRREENPGTFSVLTDHLLKLWLTSDSDLFHIGARIADRDRLMYLAFKMRQYWFGTVGAVLRQGDDRRVYPRQLCTSHGNVVTVEWTGRGAEGGAQKLKVSGVIRDFSWVSVRLVLAEKIFPAPGTVVHLDIIPAKPAVRAAKYLFRELLGPTDGLFEVVWVNKERSEIALWAVTR